jgi:hypothetical protein
MNTSKLNTKKVTFKLISLLFVLFATTSMVCAKSLDPPAKLQRDDRTMVDAEYAKLPNGRGWRIKKGPYQGDILQRDKCAQKNEKSDEEREEEEKKGEDSTGGHGASEWKLKDRNGKSRGKEFDRKGRIARKPGETGKRNEEERSGSVTQKKGKKKQGLSKDEKEKIAVGALALVGIGALCIFQPQFAPYAATLIL